MKIGIIGFGFVGQAVYSSLKEGHNADIYDKYKNMGSIEDVIKSDFIFICINTPSANGKQDNSEILEVLSTLENKRYNGIVIVKSTVLASNLDFKLNLVFNPEFLNENTFIDDFANQKLIILGGQVNFTKKVEKLYRDSFIVSPEKYEHCSLKEACNAKYIHNIYHAYKVLFWHFVQETTGNERKMVNLYQKIVNNESPEMSLLCADGKWGFGGNCFCKDVVAWDGEFGHELTKFMVGLNNRYRPDEMLPNL